jgi:hypothetical protein
LQKKSGKQHEGIVAGCIKPMSDKNFQEVVKRLKRSVEDQKNRKANVSIEDQLKVLRKERERQIQIDQVYQHRKETAAKQLREGMKEIKDKLNL